MQRPEDDEPGLDISSLIDVCFLLLIYFLVTTQIVKKEQELDMAMPSSAPSDTPPTITPMLITLEANGNISIKTDGPEEVVERDSDVRTLPILLERLEIYKSIAVNAASTPVVQIKVDGEAEQQRLIDIINALNRSEITTVTFTDILDDTDRQ
ncbi:biopolymer transporter ExbD [Akkermansiaceae bacterium]|nr:biopolymer transporter ExbD [Akkermansiaceae bacterium]